MTDEQAPGPHDLIHGLRGTFEGETWRDYRCDFCGRAPTSVEDAYDWCPLSGDTWCCSAEGCQRELDAALEAAHGPPKRGDDHGNG